MSQKPTVMDSAMGYHVALAKTVEGYGIVLEGMAQEHTILSAKVAGMEREREANLKRAVTADMEVLKLQGELDAATKKIAELEGRIVAEGYAEELKETIDGLTKRAEGLEKEVAAKATMLADANATIARMNDADAEHANKKGGGRLRGPAA